MELILDFLRNFLARFIVGAKWLGFVAVALVALYGGLEVAILYEIVQPTPIVDWVRWGIFAIATVLGIRQLFPGTGLPPTPRNGERRALNREGDGDADAPKNKRWNE